MKKKGIKITNWEEDWDKSGYAGMYVNLEKEDGEEAVIESALDVNKGTYELSIDIDRYPRIKSFTTTLDKYRPIGDDALKYLVANL